MSKFRLGSTKDDPLGQISDDDEGGLIFATSPWRGRVRIEFGEEVKWFAMPPAQAREFATILLKVAGEAEGKKPGN